MRRPAAGPPVSALMASRRLLGGAFAALAQAFNDASVLLAGFLGFALAFVRFKSREAEHDDDYSVTGVHRRIERLRAWRRLPLPGTIARHRPAWRSTCRGFSPAARCCMVS